MAKVTAKRFIKTLTIVLGVVLVWRGVWLILDFTDIALFGGSHVLTAIGGVILGLFILYAPDKDLRDIEKLL
jgi:hypothetical protein